MEGSSMERRDAGGSMPIELPCAGPSQAPSKSFEELLHLHLQGEASPFVERTVMAHLSRCPRCAERRRALIEEERELLETALRSPPLSSKFAGRVVAEIERARSEDRNRRIVRGVSRLGLGGAAAAALALAVVLWTANGGMGGRTGRESPAPVPLAAEGAVTRDAVIGDEGIGDEGIGDEGIGDEGAGEGASLPAPAEPASGRMVRVGFPPLAAECPEEMEAPPAAPLFAEGTALDGAGRIEIAHSIEFSASMFIPGRPLPCTRDVNLDGETNVSDAAHLFMLTVAHPPAGLSRNGSSEEPELECNSPCQI